MKKNGGSTGARFGLPIGNKDPLGNDWQAKINLRQAMLRISPTISLSTKMSFFGGIEKFWSEARVDVDAALEPEFEFLAAGIGYTMAAEDKAGEPLLKHDFHVPLGTSPLWVTISPRLQAEASLSAGLSGKASVGASGGYGKTMTFDYEKGRTPAALEIRAGASDFHFDLIKPEISLGGTVGAEFKLIPELDVKLISAVGFYVNIDPTLGADINADFSTGSLVSADAGVGFDGNLNAGLSVVGIDNSLLPSFQPWAFSHGKNAGISRSPSPTPPSQFWFSPRAKQSRPAAPSTSACRPTTPGASAIIGVTTGGGFSTIRPLSVSPTPAALP